MLAYRHIKWGLVSKLSIRAFWCTLGSQVHSSWIKSHLSVNWCSFLFFLAQIHKHRYPFLTGCASAFSLFRKRSKNKWIDNETVMYYVTNRVNWRSALSNKHLALEGIICFKFRHYFSFARWVRNPLIASPFSDLRSGIFGESQESGGGILFEIDIVIFWTTGKAIIVFMGAIGGRADWQSTQCSFIRRGGRLLCRRNRSE